MAFGILFGMRVSGIYKILNTANGKFYVGSSVNVESRIFKHLSHLRRGIHHNAHLQSAFSRHGEEVFDFVLLEACGVDVLLDREQHHLDTLKPDYNICTRAWNTLGYRHGPDAKAKMSIANLGNTRMLGKRLPEEAKRKLSVLASQRTMSPAHRARMSEVNKGNQHTAGRVLTQEHRAKVSAGLQGAWATSRSKEEAAERLRARWADPEWKARQLQKIAAAKAAKRPKHGLE